MSGGSNAVSAWAKAGASAQAESQVTAINCLTEFIVPYPIEKPEAHSACIGDAAHARAPCRRGFLCICGGTVPRQGEAGRALATADLAVTLESDPALRF